MSPLTEPWCVYQNQVTDIRITLLTKLRTIWITSFSTNALLVFQDLQDFTYHLVQFLLKQNLDLLNPRSPWWTDNWCKWLQTISLPGCLWFLVSSSWGKSYGKKMKEEFRTSHRDTERAHKRCYPTFMGGGAAYST